MRSSQKAILIEHWSHLLFQHLAGSQHLKIQVSLTRQRLKLSTCLLFHPYIPASLHVGLNAADEIATELRKIEHYILR
jgi:hypothetical protein